MSHPLYLHVPNDEFDEEPEDELASAGMHVVENDEKDEDVVDEKPDEIVEDEGAEKELEEADKAPDGLEELEELEKEVTNAPLTFGGTDDET